MTENNYCRDNNCLKKHKSNIKTRFINNKGSILPFDTIAQEGRESIPISKVSDLLNELHEENEELKEKVKQLQRLIDTQKLINESLRINEECNKKAIQKLIVQRIENKKWVNDKISDLECENEQLKQQMQRLYYYFADWFDDIMPSCNFSEMWDCVKEDEEWDL